MVSFPALTPSRFTWEAPQYVYALHESEDLLTTPTVYADKPGNGALGLEFANRPDSDLEAMLAAYDQAKGRWDVLILPAELWAGRDAGLAGLIESFDPDLQWSFAERPTGAWAKRGRVSISVRLVCRLRPVTVELTNPAPGAGTPIPVDDGVPAVVDDLPPFNCKIGGTVA